MEYDKLIDRQLERAAITTISGFGSFVRIRLITSLRRSGERVSIGFFGQPAYLIVMYF